MASSSSKSPSMNVEAVLRMKEGVGETSYAQNSSLQKKSMDTVKKLVTESATDVYVSLRPGRFTMADLGCSSGTNALGMVEDIIRSIAEVCGASPSPEFSVLLNDLPTNDFNTTFSGFPEFAGRVKAGVEKQPLVFLSGVPGSFYGRLFPTGSVHLVCSFSSLLWLSQIPPGVHDQDSKGPINKGKMFISSTSPPAVPAAYLGQFQRDFTLFLESRAAEVVAGGRMVLSMLGREADCCTDDKTTLLWDLLSDALAALVEMGLLEQDKVDTYDVPFYPPCIREIEEEVRKEGSFALDYAGTFEYQLNPAGGSGAKAAAAAAAQTVSMAIRAIQESMLNHHFGPAIIDPLFNKYAELIGQAMERQDAKGVQLGLVLLKL
uniref:Uncharacterized protein n=1 Tax=Avena sativa TaxID=4498 RepID=A0ACD6AB09_AVESA